MAVYSHIKVKQQGPQYLKDNVTAIHLVKNIVNGEGYSTSIARSIATTSFGSSDAVLTTVSNEAVLTLAAKAGIDPTGTATSGDDLSVIYVSGTEVLLTLNATNRDIVNGAGDTIDIPEAVYYVRENAAV